MGTAAARIAHELLHNPGGPEGTRRAEAVLVDELAHLDLGSIASEHLFGLYEEAVLALSRARRGDNRGVDQARVLLAPLAFVEKRVAKIETPRSIMRPSVNRAFRKLLAG